MPLLSCCTSVRCLMGWHVALLLPAFSSCPSSAAVPCACRLLPSCSLPRSRRPRAATSELPRFGVGRACAPAPRAARGAANVVGAVGAGTKLEIHARATPLSRVVAFRSQPGCGRAALVDAVARLQRHVYVLRQVAVVLPHLQWRTRARGTTRGTAKGNARGTTSRTTAMTCVRCTQPPSHKTGGRAPPNDRRRCRRSRLPNGGRPRMPTERAGGAR